MHFHGVSLESQHEIWSKQHNGKVSYVRGSSQVEDYIRAVNHGATRDGINTEPLLAMPVALPSIAEQRRIVDELDTQFTRLDAAVTAFKRVQANLKRYRASVLQAACTGRLVPTEAELAHAEGCTYESAEQLLHRMLQERRAKWEAEQLANMQVEGKAPKDDRWKSKYREPVKPDTSELPKLPEGWVWSSTEQCTTIITDGEHITPERAASGVLLLSARNVHNGRLPLDQVDYIPEHEYERIARRLAIESGDVLLSCSGSVGRSCVAPPNLKFALVRIVSVLKPLLGMCSYLSLALRSPLLQEQIVEKKTQTAQSNIFQGKIKTLMFPLPPLPEQYRIVAEVERRLSIIDELEAVIVTNLKRANRLRQAMLKRAFAGKLVPQDPTDEPASVLLERIRMERERGTEKPKAIPQQTKTPRSMVQVKAVAPIQGELALEFRE